MTLHHTKVCLCSSTCHDEQELTAASTGRQHHATYVAGLNTALEKYEAALQGTGEADVKGLIGLQAAMKFNGGGTRPSAQTRSRARPGMCMILQPVKLDWTRLPSSKVGNAVCTPDGRLG